MGSGKIIPSYCYVLFILLLISSSKFLFAVDVTYHYRYRHHYNFMEGYESVNSWNFPVVWMWKISEQLFNW